MFRQYHGRDASSGLNHKDSEQIEEIAH